MSLVDQRRSHVFQDIQTAAEYLAELIGEARLLLVVDDVWREAQLRPFLKGGPNCVRLVTTRLPQVLPRSHLPVAIDEMRANEALSLIAANLPGGTCLPRDGVPMRLHSSCWAMQGSGSTMPHSANGRPTRPCRWKPADCRNGLHDHPALRRLLRASGLSSVRVIRCSTGSNAMRQVTVGSE
jgi:hypothetical protein